MFPTSPNNPTLVQGWIPFDQENWSQLVGELEYAYLFTYALAMIGSGYVAERMNIRYFLTLGMFLSGICNIAFGAAQYFEIHQYHYFLFIQLLSGVVQATGWPAVVTLMGNWWGKKRRGFIMGVWNAHTSVGNIVGSLIAGHYVESDWGASFIVPGLLLMTASALVFLTLVDRPETVQLHRVRTCESPRGNPDSASALHPPEPSSLTFNESESMDILSPPVQYNKRAVTFSEALLLPNVLAFSLLLFFTKLVSYTFLYWLPNYLAAVVGDGSPLTAERAAQLSVVFDVGGILGGILAGLLSDSQDRDAYAITSRRAITCCIMLAAAVPSMLLYQTVSFSVGVLSVVLLFCCGLFVNGPYALITTAVSADLGTQRVLHDRARALATVTSIIDGAGSFGAAFGPFLTGILVPYGWSAVFQLLLFSDLIALFIAVCIYCRTRRSYAC